MADFFFFTDAEKLNGNPEPFGPISNTQYRVSSNHSSTFPSINAYAICKGRVFVQEVSGTLVNLILKPFDQPLGVNPNVKFYIYRNILKSSLIDATDKINPNQSTLGSEIDKNNFIPSPKPSDVLGVKATNLITNFSNTDSIDNAFYLTSDPNYQIWTAHGGWSIGKFDPSGFGFEIILDTVGYEPKLSIARNPIHVIDINGTQSNSIDFFKRQLEREEILNYLDPCAFYLNFINSGNQLKINNNNNGDKTTAVDFSDATDIYTQLSGGFANKNRIYVDVRNELNDSFDFQWNYGNIVNFPNVHPVLKVIYDNTSTTSSDINYYSPWPLLIINSDPNNPTNNPFQATEFASRHILKLSFPKGNNNTQLFFIQSGFINKNNEANFPGVLSEDERFFTQEFNTSTNYSLPISFAILKDGSNLPVGSYIHVKYIRQQEQLIFDANGDPLVPPTISGTIFNATEYLDNIFPAFKIDNSNNVVNLFQLPWENTPLNKIKSNIYYDGFFVDNTRFSGRVFFAHRGIGIDPSNSRTLFCYTTGRANFGQGLIDSSLPLTGSNDSVNDLQATFLEEFTKKPNNLDGEDTLLYQKIRFNDTINGTNVTKIIDSVNNTNVNDSIFTNSTVDFLNIKFTDAEWTAIKNTITANNATLNLVKESKIYFGLKFVTSDMSVVTVEDETNPSYQQNSIFVAYEIVLRAYRESGGNISLTEIANLNNGAPIYHISLLPNIDVIEVDHNLKIEGKTHNIKDNLNVSTSQAALEQIIESKLCLTRGAHLSPDEFKNYFKYFRDNIRQIWTSYDSQNLKTLANKAIASQNSPNQLIRQLKKVTTNENAPQVGAYVNISAYPVLTSPNNYLSKGVEFNLGLSQHFEKVKDTEVIVYVSKGNGRAFTSGSRRLMSMLYEVHANQQSTYYIPRKFDNTPAHEFGHVLGLADRYTYIGLVDIPAGSNNLPQKAIADNFGINPFYSRNIPLYLPDDYDFDYTTKYRWAHNLMATQVRTPLTSEMGVNTPMPTNGKDGSQLKPEKDYVTEYSHPTFLPTGAVNPSLEFPYISVFITQKQWEIISLKQEESVLLPEYFRFVRHVFFKEGPSTTYPTYNTAPTATHQDRFLGSFVGKKLDPNQTNDKPLVSDHMFAYSNTSPTSDDIDTNGAMDLRIRDGALPNFISTVNTTRIIAHVGPYDNGGSNSIALDEGLATGDNNNSIRYRMGIERGENYSGNSGINNLIDKAFQERVEPIVNAFKTLKEQRKLNPTTAFIYPTFNYTVKPVQNLSTSPTLVASGERVFFKCKFLADGPNFSNEDDFVNNGYTGGKDYNFGYFKVYPSLDLNNLNSYKLEPLESNKYNFDLGYLIWNHVFKFNPSLPQPFNSQKFTVTTIKNLFFPNDFTGETFSSPDNFNLGWDTYSNRNIIIGIIREGEIDIIGANPFNKFRNHKGIDFRPNDPTQDSF